MKLLFSEHKSDYDHYIFPYAVWAVPESGETAADLFNAGFLPSSRNLDRFYLCRHVRVQLGRFKPSSENRRILRKGGGIEERLDLLFRSPIISHLLVFTDAKSGAEVGTATLYLEGKELAFYYYAFYDLNYYSRNLGMFMMTSAAAFFAERNFRHLYLGTCYSQNALYKTQFAGAAVFQRIERGAADARLARRDKQETGRHLLESDEYRQLFHKDNLDKIASACAFRVKLS